MCSSPVEKVADDVRVELLDVLRTYVLNCMTGTDEGPVASADDAGTSDLRYEGNGRWRFNWKTSNTFQGTCRSSSAVVDHSGRNDVRINFGQGASQTCVVGHGCGHNRRACGMLGHTEPIRHRRPLWHGRGFCD